MSVAELAGELPVFLQGVHNPNHPEWMRFNPVPAGVTIRALEAILAAISNIPAYRIIWGPSFDDLLAEVPLLRRAQRALLACATRDRPKDDAEPLPHPTADSTPASARVR
jgi:hypothetical protein